MRCSSLGTETAREGGYIPAAAFVNAYLVWRQRTAFYWLEQAFKEKSNILQFLKTHPYFDPIRTDPRFGIWSVASGLITPRDRGACAACGIANYLSKIRSSTPSSAKRSKSHFDPGAASPRVHQRGPSDEAYLRAESRGWEELSFVFGASASANSVNFAWASGVGFGGGVVGRNRNSDLGKEFFLSGRRTDTEQACSPVSDVSELVRGVGGNMNRLAGLDGRLGAAEGGLNLALEDDEALLEVMRCGGGLHRADVHVDETVVSGSVFCGEKNGVGVSHQANMGNLGVIRVGVSQIPAGSSGGIALGESPVAPC